MLAGGKGWKSPLSLGRCGRHNPWARRRWQSPSGAVSPPRKSLQLLIPTPHALVSPSTGSFPALEPAWGWQRRVQPGESPCPPAQPVPCSDSRELPSRTLLTALPGDAEASVPPSRVTPRGSPSGSQPRGVRGAICPSPRRWLVSLPALPRPSAAAGSPATAGGLFHSNSLRWLPREGHFYPGTGLWQDIPPAFSAGCFSHLPSSGGACRAVNAAGS